MDRSVLHQLSYGVYAVTTLDGERQVGCVANSAMQISSRPATVAVSINHDNFTNACIARTGRFALSVFGEQSNVDEIRVLGYKSCSEVDKFAELPHQTVDGLPVFDDAVGYGLFKVVNSMESETHTVFLGEMYDGAMLAGGEPMTYRYYREVMKGTSPKNAPTYEAPKVPQEKEEAMSEKKVWKCSICGYIYDGDTPFEQLPDDWTCPLCGASKDQFEEVDA